VEWRKEGVFGGEEEKSKESALTKFDKRLEQRQPVRNRGKVQPSKRKGGGKTVEIQTSAMAKKANHRNKVNKHLAPTWVLRPGGGNTKTVF